MMKNYRLPGIAVLLFAAVLLAIPGKDSFTLESAEVLNRIEQQDFIIDSARMNALVKEGAVVADLGGTETSGDHPISGTLSLPLEEWDVKTIRKSFPVQGKYILCGGDLSERSMAWVLLTQMGRDQVWVLGIGSVHTAGMDDPAFVFRPDPGLPQ